MNKSFLKIRSPVRSSLYLIGGSLTLCLLILGDDSRTSRPQRPSSLLTFVLQYYFLFCDITHVTRVRLDWQYLHTRKSNRHKCFVHVWSSRSILTLIVFRVHCLCPLGGEAFKGRRTGNVLYFIYWNRVLPSKPRALQICDRNMDGYGMGFF